MGWPRIGGIFYAAPDDPSAFTRALPGQQVLGFDQNGRDLVLGRAWANEVDGRRWDLGLPPGEVNQQLAQLGNLDGALGPAANGLFLGDEFRGRANWAEGGGGGGFGEFADGEMAEAARARRRAYYESIVLPVREYAHQHVAGEDNVRVDFTETLYWNPLLITDENGIASVEFELCDSVTTFRVSTDAHGSERIGGGQAEIVSRIPFNIEPQLPLQVTAGDRIDLPVALVNDSDGELPVDLSLEFAELFQLDGEAMQQLALAAGDRQRVYFPLQVVGDVGAGTIELRANAETLSDAVRREVEVVPSGFPFIESFAGRLAGHEQVVLELPEEWVPGSLVVDMKVFPSSLADLQEGVAGILKEPGGCFEQTSSSNYPNIMALYYMQQHDVADPAFTRRAKEMLDRGYARLVSFECNELGYEWFGGDPGHEALTAYGIMQFRDLGEVWTGDADMETMIGRTAEWLLERRDGNGGFLRNSRALDSFGRASAEVTDAYIVWALTEAGYGREEIATEIDHVTELARGGEDAYVIALAACAVENAGELHVAAELREKLATLQQEDGHLAAANGTITRSGGVSMQVETTAVAALAWLADPAFTDQANRAIQWITDHRSGGTFGSTQATILALKALVAHAAANQREMTDGSLIITRDGEQVATEGFSAGQTRAIEIDDLAATLTPGENTLTLELTGDNEMPYVIDLSYRTHLPPSSDACPVQLTTSLSAETATAGDQVGLQVSLENTSGSGQPMTMAIVGLPAGLEPRIERLEELRDAGEFDYYEIESRELIFYWRSLGPDVLEANKIDFTVDLAAAIPGSYTGPASRTYLYYTPEEKQWVTPLAIEIERRD